MQLLNAQNANLPVSLACLVFKHVKMTVLQPTSWKSPSLQSMLSVLMLTEARKLTLELLDSKVRKRSGYDSLRNSEPTNKITTNTLTACLDYGPQLLVKLIKVPSKQRDFPSEGSASMSKYRSHVRLLVGLCLQFDLVLLSGPCSLWCKWWWQQILTLLSVSLPALIWLSDAASLPVAFNFLDSVCVRVQNSLLCGCGVDTLGLAHISSCMSWRARWKHLWMLCTFVP